MATFLSCDLLWPVAQIHVLIPREQSKQVVFFPPFLLAYALIQFSSILNPVVRPLHNSRFRYLLPLSDCTLIVQSDNDLMVVRKKELWHSVLH